MQRNGLIGAGAACCLVGVLAAGAAIAQTTGKLTVQATDVIYAAGTQSGEAGPAGGTVPKGIMTLPAGAKGVYFSVTGSYTCTSPEGCSTVNSGSGTNYNDPDGAYAQVSGSSAVGYDSISGITAPGAGYLVGVFIAADGPTGHAPPSLNFTVPPGTASPSGHPRLDQVFFIGAGLTGDASGTRQVAYVPKGATQLVLGISDDCGYSGKPSCYFDNFGTYTVKYKVLVSGQ
jgi:hypothetical protein